MTVTYDITTNVGKVRLIISDNILTNYKFTDEELQYFITSGGSVGLGAAGALEAWAASYATNADNEKIGDYSYAQSITKKMLDLAAKLRATDASTPYLTWAEMDLSGVEDTTVSEDIE